MWKPHLEALSDLVHCVEYAENQPRSRSTKTPPIHQLRDRRNVAGFSRMALARRAQISDATVKFIETARYPPSRATLLRWLAVPELELTWNDFPGELGEAPLPMVSSAGMMDAAACAEPQTVLNCYLSPTMDPVRMVTELGQLLNGAGGLVAAASVYLEHQSAAQYLALCQQNGPIADHRRSLPLDKIAKCLTALSDDAALSLIAIGAGDAHSELRLAQLLLEARPQLVLRLSLLDISQPLLSCARRHALEVLGTRPGLEIVAVHGDWNDLPILETIDGAPEALGRASPRRRRVYCLFGGTLDCLDHELRFIHHSLNAQADDWLILDVLPVRGDDPVMQTSDDNLVVAPLSSACTEWLAATIRRHCSDVDSIDFSLGRDRHLVVPNSYALEAIASVQRAEGAARQFVRLRWKRYEIAELVRCVTQLGWAHEVTLPFGEQDQPAVTLLFRKRAARDPDSREPSASPAATE